MVPAGRDSLAQETEHKGQPTTRSRILAASNGCSILSMVVRQQIMNDNFIFLNPGKLVDDDLRLVLVKKHPANLKKKHVPWYQFDMRKMGAGRKIGRISLRIGSARQLRCPGHMGYRVNKPYRGNHFAVRSCRLLLPFAAVHGIKALWITCDPHNMASRRTIELAGAKHIGTIRIPKDHEMYKKGARRLRRYRINLKEKLSNARSSRPVRQIRR
jgi:predicted acetyltransferase